jgi:hypothetical protein
MKKKVLIIFLFIGVMSYAQTSNQIIDTIFFNFINFFPDLKIPYLSKDLNKVGYYDLDKKYTLIPKELSLKYICNGDIQNMFYSYVLIDGETGKSKGLQKKEYKFYAIFKHKLFKNILIAYPKIDTKSIKYYLALYDFSGNLMDTLLLNQKIGENECWEWQASYIEEKKLTTYNYKANPEFLNYVRKNTEEIIPRTIITITTYNINSNIGKFELQKQETKYSQCSVDEFASGIEKCRSDDPMSLLPK